MKHYNRNYKQYKRQHQQEEDRKREDRFTWQPEDLIVFRTEQEYRDYINKPFPAWKDW